MSANDSGQPRRVAQRAATDRPAQCRGRPGRHAARRGRRCRRGSRLRRRRGQPGPRRPDRRGGRRRRPAGRQRHAARPAHPLDKWERAFARSHAVGRPALRAARDRRPRRPPELGPRHPGRRRPRRLAPPRRALRAAALDLRRPGRRPVGRPAARRPQARRAAAGDAGDVRHAGRHRDRQRPAGRSGCASQRGVLPARVRERAVRHVHRRLHAGRPPVASCGSTRRCAGCWATAGASCRSAASPTSPTPTTGRPTTSRSAGLSSGEIDRYQLEKRYLRADGQPVWVSLQTSVVRDSAGRRSTASRSSRTSATGAPSTRS